MTGFDCYRTYLAFKNHFTKDNFDYFKYGGKTNATTTSFNKRKDKYFFEKMSRQKKDEDIVDYFTAIFSQCDYQPLTQFMFHSAKSSLDKIGKIHAIERTLYSEYLGLAGRVDCIAEYDGGLAVIDFKTSKKIKPEEWIEQYFVQEVAYACMYYELTGIPIQKLITIMVTPNGEVKVYDKRNKGDYIKLLVKYVKEFIKNRMVVNG